MTDTLILWLLSLSRWHKRALQAAFDMASAFACFGLIFFVLPQLSMIFIPVPKSLGWALVFGVIVVGASQTFGLYRAWVRYSGVRALQSILISVAFAGIVTWVLSVLFGQALHSVGILVVLVLTVAVMAMGRLLLRELFYLARKSEKPNVVLYGAGDAGRQLLTSFAQSSSYRVVAMVDDAPALQGSEVHGVRIYPPSALKELQHRYQVQAVILCAPSMPRQRKNQILNQLEALGLPLKTLPSLSDIFSGRKSLADLHQISIEEVLGRDPVAPYPELLQKKVTGRSVMVTGGGGSIGKELCLQIAGLSPSCLVILDSSEFALYTVTTELHDRMAVHAQGVQAFPKIVPVLQSVLDEQALLSCLQAHAVETVFHAAAFKHVPLVEANPFAGLQNNVFGTLSAIRASEAAGVKDFLLISTDKAVRPTNIMGASKRLAELIAQARAQEQSAMSIAMVRFGNVLSSSGSVIPRFKEQIAAGGPVTVTHPDITRFFMTIPEAVELVLQATGLAKGGEVYLLEMGEPVRIVDLAKRMIRLSGYRPVVHASSAPAGSVPIGIPRAVASHDIAIVFSGLRPGEKLYEELLIEAGAQSTAHPKIFMARESCLSWVQLEPLLSRLQQGITKKDLSVVKALLQELPLGYSKDEAQTRSDLSAVTGGVSPSPDLAISLSEPTELAMPALGGPDVEQSSAAVTADDHREPRKEKKINPFLSKLLHGYFLLRRPMTLGVRAVVVNDQQEVMLVRHRYEPGWQLPGGGVESGESPLEALRRELMEEVSLRVDRVDRFLGVFFNSEVSRRDHVMVYLVSEFLQCPRSELSDEIIEHGFFSLKNLPSDTTTGTRRRLSEVFERQEVGHVW